ncbi:DUF4111 domain-containing protein [Ornithinibacillus sp. L9]|uniref:Spectinomycin 9-adenylyltransferase n=1 Tax=Ornithinibacillus caprae TaxID=2678566 RepID=A0A6N8FRX4_9BACI|nr:aminoglycoside adenylyltransferase domain-containing protein [Ornithinibacillus caprae]MUK90658.1 DUF4111 domain-containing protein [Ornithinibacillus caprae]
MENSWVDCSLEIKNLVFHLLEEIKGIVEEDFMGLYIHGSLAMGGFNPKSSDIDLIVVTATSLSTVKKEKLANLFITYSGKPFPIEISFLTRDQLKNWEHPSQYDFHYSEYWRERYKDDLSNGKNQYLNEEDKSDGDLAAHITIIRNRGICIEGMPIEETFPIVPHSHYISSIMGDFEECIQNIEKEPIYCILNMLRVYLFLKEGLISSKLEAGKLGMKFLPKKACSTVQKVVNHYLGDQGLNEFESNELLFIKDVIVSNVQELLSFDQVDYK